MILLVDKFFVDDIAVQQICCHEAERQQASAGGASLLELQDRHQKDAAEQKDRRSRLEIFSGKLQRTEEREQIPADSQVFR